MLSAGALALGIMPIEPPPFAEIATAAIAGATAIRLDPPITAVEAVDDPVPAGSSASSNGRCTGYEPLLERYSPGWSVPAMSKVMYRESRCRPEVRNRHSTATGLLQVLGSHCVWLRDVLDGCSVQLLQDATYNIRAAAELWRRQGMGAWAT